MIPMDKPDGLRKRALLVLAEQLERMATAAEAARADAQCRANEHAGKIESRFDTFREEAQYLAYGQACRRERLLRYLEACRRMLAAVEEERDHPAGRVRPGVIVELASEFGETRHYLIAPGGLGVRVMVDSMEIMVVSVEAPLARALLGLEEGDPVEMGEAAEKGVEWVVDKVI
jgi:transcription elongation GreA/GreB family factor